MQGHIVLKPGPVTGVTASTTASGFTTPQTDTVGAIIIVETNDVRMKWDGVSPTSVSGLLMKKDSVWEISSRDVLVAMLFCSVTSDGYVTCSELKGY